jgi:hypothetical protein
MDILEYIKKMQEMYGDDVITTADKINRPDPKPIVKEIEAINEFVKRNPRADGGRIGFKRGKNLDRAAYKEIRPITQANIDNYTYFTSIEEAKPYKFKVQLPSGTEVFKTKEEAQAAIDAAPITNRDYTEGLIDFKVQEGSVEFDAGRIKTPTGEYVGTGRDKAQIFKIQNKDGSGKIRYTAVGAGGGKKKLYDSIEEVKKAKLDFTPDELVKVGKPKKIKQNINEITYKNKKTGKIVKYYKPMIGVDKITIKGKGAETLKEAEEFVKNYFEKNPRKPHKSTAKLEKDLKALYGDSRIKKILRTGRPSKKDLDIVKDILDVTDRQAQGKLAQLADAVNPKGQRTIDGISKIDGKKAKNIFNFHKTKDIAKELEDIELGKAVGERPLDVFRKDIQSAIPMKGGIEGYSVDEAHARAAAMRLNSKPYSIFGQVIAGNINQGPKETFDANLSIFEEQVKNAIKNNQDPTEFIEKYNKRAAEAEDAANRYKSRNTKKVYFPRITTDSPDIAIKNKSAYTKYKKFFDKNYAQQGYSFVIPKDLQPLPSLAADLQNKNSSIYKNMIKQIKDVGRKFIKNIDQYDEKELFQKLRNNPNFNKIRRLMPKLASLEDDISNKRYAALNNTMTSGVKYVDDAKENFIERNPLTTGAALTGTGTAGVLKAAGVPIKQAAGRAFRTLGTRAGAVPLAGYTIYDNLKKGENIVDATLDPFVGAELMFPNLFKENVAKITSNPTLQKILKVGKYGRMFTPVGAGITAAGLGIDAYKKARNEYQKLQGMTKKEKLDYLADQYEDLGGVYGEGAADGGLIGDKSGPAPTGGPMSQGLRSLYNNGKKL